MPRVSKKDKGLRPTSIGGRENSLVWALEKEIDRGHSGDPQQVLRLLQQIDSATTTLPSLRERIKALLLTFLTIPYPHLETLILGLWHPLSPWLSHRDFTLALLQNPNIPLANAEAGLANALSEGFGAAAQKAWRRNPVSALFALEEPEKASVLAVPIEKPASYTFHNISSAGIPSFRAGGKRACNARRSCLTITRILTTVVSPVTSLYG